MFFQGWMDIVRVVVVGTLAYIGLVAFLRISGKRTLTKLNAFDLVVTVALGSTLSSMLTSKTTSLVQGLVAFALLIVLQYVITWASVRWRGLETLIKAEPSLLLHKGRMLEGALLNQRVTREEVLAVLRSNGHSEIASVAAVILETDGSFSVIGDINGGAATLEDLAKRSV